MAECSVIISFYNKINYLKLLLEGFERQSYKDFEVIIADDGSRPEIVAQIKEIQQQYFFDITHVWHEDLGWRKNEILNKAVCQAKTPYVIFVDGDCIPHKHFVKEHLIYKQSGVCLTGRRVNLSQEMTDKITTESVKNGDLEHIVLEFIISSFKKKINHIEAGFYLKNKYLRKWSSEKKIGILGCNFSLYKEDLLKINGFDERYKTATVGEDTDIGYRLELLGMKVKSIKNLAIQYHLYHVELERLQINWLIFEQTKRDAMAFTPFGIVKTSEL